MSNQNTKLFPADFFQSKESERRPGFNTERHNRIQVSATTTKEFKNPSDLVIVPRRVCSGKDSSKAIIDDDKELEEDREFLELFNDHPITSRKHCKHNFNCLVTVKSPILDVKNKEKPMRVISPNNMKNIYNLKGTGFEMIPEEDEDRLRTEYNTKGKFFGKDQPVENMLKESIMSNFQLDEPSDMNNSNKTISLLIEEIRNKNMMEVKEFNSKFKGTVRITSPIYNDKYLQDNRAQSQIAIHRENIPINNSKSVVRVRHIRQTSHDRYTEPLLSVECSNDSSKNLRSINIKTEESRNKPVRTDTPALKPKLQTKSSFTFRDSSKTLEKVNVLRPEEFRQLPVRPTNVFSPRISKKLEDHEKSSSNNYSNNTTPEKTGVKSHRDISLTIKRDLKPDTPPSLVSNKLPAITTSRRKTNFNYDISNIFQAANNYKEDPLIKMKLDDIMQNIADIKSVLNQKTKARIKVSSAPSNVEDRLINTGSVPNADKDSKGMTFCKMVPTKKLVNNRSFIPKLSKENDKSPIKLVRK